MSEHAHHQAEAQLKNILALVERLNHARECDGEEECSADHKTLAAGLGLSPAAELTHEDLRDYHDEDKVMSAILEDPLEVLVRSEWHGMGDSYPPMQYCILLCTGGPAVRIIGDLSLEHRTPESCTLQYQDWFTEWMDYPLSKNEIELVLTYVQQFFTDLGLLDAL